MIVESLTKNMLWDELIFADFTKYSSVTQNMSPQRIKQPAKLHIALEFMCLKYALSISNQF